MDLSIRIYYDMEKYSRNELEDYVKVYAERMGFDLEPRKFIELFVKSGILSFDTGTVEIGIPVIRAYMLAKGLAAKGIDGLDYFNLDGFDCDLQTFDLYCEFNNDHSVYELVNKKVSESIAYFESKPSSNGSAVSSGLVNSRLLAKSLDVSAFSDEISEKAREISDISSLVDEKQARIDIESSLRRSKSAQNVEKSIEDYPSEHVGANRFVASVFMLGSAAERMEDDVKRTTIKNILRIADLISSDIIALRSSSIDIDQIAAEMLEEIHSSGAFAVDGDEAEKDLKELVELIVADWEFNMLASPIMATLSFLCEIGRTNVLISPITRTPAGSRLEYLYRNGWVFDLDPVGQRKMAPELSKQLGSHPFLRVIFGLVMFHRTYWYHHGQLKRKAMVKGIDEIFKPLSIKSNFEIDDLD